MAAHQPGCRQRLEAVLEGLQERGLGHLLVTHPPHLRYLTGLEASAGALLVGAERTLLLVDGRYLTAARHLSGGWPEGRLEVHYVEGSVEESVAAVLGQLPDMPAVGVEGDVMTLTRFERLQHLVQGAIAPGRPQPRLVPVTGLIERLRLIKDNGEIATLRRAAALLSAVAAEVLPLVRVGRTEREVAADIDYAVRRAGFERPAFETIVASGPNSALPHARPRDRRLEAADGVVLDFGGVYDGYCVDLTRTIQMPPATEEFGRLFDAVREAHAAALACIRPGVAAGAVDAAAREALAARGLADAFTHATGHGLGLEVHEAPRISSSGPGAGERLRVGMVFTVEPGVYVPGIGGVRLEDDVLVVDQGCEVLTRVPIERTGADLAVAPYLAGE